MNRVLVSRLILQASSHLNQTTPLLIRASSNFLVNQSLDNAIHELQQSQKILQQAKELYLSSPSSSSFFTPVPPITTSPSSS